MNNIKSLLKDGLIISQDQTINEAKQVIKILLSKIENLEAINNELINAVQVLFNQCSLGGIEYLENKHGYNFSELIERAKELK